MIVPGSTSQELAAGLAAETGQPLAETSRRRFPDGELLASLEGFQGPEATVVCATTDDAAHLELLQLQDAARAAGAEAVTTVLPYMGYARQDAAFEPGEPNSARALARAIGSGTERVVLVSPHEPSVAERFPVPVTVVDGGRALADGLPSELNDPAFVAPDAGAIELAETVRDGYGRGTAHQLEKTRNGDTVRIESGGGDIDGRDVVLVDDIVATAGTMSAAIDALDATGRVVVACVHAVFADGARTRLERAGVDRVIATDTIERPASDVSVAPLVAAHC